MSKLMKKYAKIEEQESGSISVLLMEPEEPEALELATKYGMELMEVEQADDGNYYLPGHVPVVALTYAEQRQQSYPQLTEQLDMLYHDIDQGKLGDTAKDSSFYLALKQVKETYPKNINAEEPPEV